MDALPSDLLYCGFDVLGLLERKLNALNLAIIINPSQEGTIEMIEPTAQVLAHLFLHLIRQDDLGGHDEHFLICPLLEVPHFKCLTHGLAHQSRRYQFALPGKLKHDLVIVAADDLVHECMPGVLLVGEWLSCQAHR